MWVNGSVEGIGQRLVEHVIGHLPGGIATAARVIPEYDLEIFQPYLLSWESVGPSSGVGFTVKREVVLEHKHRNRRGRQRIGFDIHSHTGWQRARTGRAAGRAGRANRGAPHGVPAAARSKASRVRWRRISAVE